jgi:hypothetical protein
MRHCLFCNETKLTKEHLWPDWIVDLFSPQTQAINFRRSDGTRKKWNQPTLTLTQKLMCQQCNNVNIGSIEHVVKPILEPLINSASARTLDGPDRLALTTWFLARSMIWDGMEGSSKAYYSHSERVSFATSDPLTFPPNLHVWIGTV